MNFENDELKINGKQVFKNNLILLKQHKIHHICALSRIPGLFALCRIFNQSVLENGNNSTLANGHYCTQLSISKIYEKMSKRTQKKYFQYQKEIPQIDKDLLRHDIRMLIVAEVIRKVDFKDLTPQKQAIIINEKKIFNKGKTTYDVYTSVPFYEVLDLRHSHLERLTKLKHQKDLSYPIVQQMFGDKIADNCFNSTIRDYKNGLNTSSENTFKRIVDVIKKDKVVALKDLSEYCAQNFSLSNGNYKSQVWWSRQLKGFDFKQEGITMCHNSELSKKMKLDIHGNSLVLIAQK